MKTYEIWEGDRAYAEEIDTNNILDALADWAEDMDICGNYYITQSDRHGVLVNVAEKGSDDIKVFRVVAEPSIEYHVSRIK